MMLMKSFGDDWKDTTEIRYIWIYSFTKKNTHIYILHSDKRKQFTTRQRSQQRRRRWLISLQSNKSRSNSNKQPNRKTKRKQCTKESNKQETKQLLVVRSADVQRNPKASNKLRKTKKVHKRTNIKLFLLLSIMFGFFF